MQGIMCRGVATGKGVKESIALATEIKLRAERKAGEILRETPKNEGAKGNPGGQGAPVVQSQSSTAQKPTLADLGVTKKESSRFQKLASVLEPLDQSVFLKQRVLRIDGIHPRLGHLFPAPDDEETGDKASDEHQQKKFDPVHVSLSSTWRAAGLVQDEVLPNGHSEALLGHPGGAGTGGGEQEAEGQEGSGEETVEDHGREAVQARPDWFRSATSRM